MDWQTLIKRLKGEGYEGDEKDLIAVKAFIDEKFGGAVDNGEAIDIDALHVKAYPPKPNLDMTSESQAKTVADLVSAEMADTLGQLGINKPEGEKTEHKHVITGGKMMLADDPKGGFKSSGDFYHNVFKAGGHEGGFNNPKSGDPLDLWIKAAASTISVEQTGVDGGFAVPPEFRDQIMIRVQGEDSILSRCDQTSISRTSLTIPIDETTPWQTTGGIQTTWEGETKAMSQSKVALKDRTWRANKLTCLVPVSDELLEDAPAMSSYIPRKASEKIDFKIGEAIFRGTGVGQPDGFLNSSNIIEVAKETGQDGDTIIAHNVQKMHQRMFAQYRANAVWFINQDCETQLQRLFIQGVTDAGTGVAGGSLVFMPAGGLTGSPFAQLFGRPVIPTQHCETIGDVGDIILADMKQYHCVMKGGVKSDQSIHLWFDQGLTAFRFVIRIGGAVWNNTTISPRDGSNTMAAFITLAVRT